MESLQIRTGMLALNILDDNGEVRGVFNFNPQDVKIGQKVFDMIADFQVKQLEFDKKKADCSGPEDVLKLLNEMIAYYKEEIDSTWGENSSKTLFGDANTITMFEDFFSGITPYYTRESKKRTAKYKK